MSKRLVCLGLAWGLVLGAAAGCDDDDVLPGTGTDGGGGGTGGSDGPAPADGPAGSDGPVSELGAADGLPDGPRGEASGTLSAAGGRLVSADGRVILDVPRGALTRPSYIEIKPATPPGPGALGASYELSPQSVVLAKPARLSFRFTDGEIGSSRPTDLRVGHYAGAHWIALAGGANSSERAVYGAVSRFGVFALLPGACSACPAACSAATCKFGDDPASQVPGKCVPQGNGCSVCVPACDADGDGACTGNPGAGQPGGDCRDDDATVSPRATEVCGNNQDDNCNGHVDEGCKACSGDDQCPAGSQACLDGVCNVCETGCNPASCRFDNPVAGMPPIPGQCLRYGQGCNVCVPTCDMDGDGFCPGPPAMGLPGNDCDDSKRGVRPNGTELCGNDLDDDCNGFADDGCSGCQSDTDCSKEGQFCLHRACQGCRKTCEPGAACTFGDQAMAGKCVAFGKGCARCVPTCDGDGDGHCPPGDCRDDLRDVFPGGEGVEVCGNEIDDDCDGHFNDGCRTCSSDGDCPQGLEACINGICEVCPGGGGCDPAECRFGRIPMTPGSGVAGRCASYGQGCKRCVPACDMDGDGFCPGNPGMEQPGGDCNDMNASAYPMALEVCGNMADDDCDGLVDEGCNVCSTGAMCAAGELCSTMR